MYENKRVVDIFFKDLKNKGLLDIITKRSKEADIKPLIKNTIHILSKHLQETTCLYISRDKVVCNLLH